jgi:glycosyltransferase involved in cell wall biosynthesis
MANCNRILPPFVTTQEPRYEATQIRPMSPLSLSQEPFDGELMSRLRILLLAPDANPEAISLALEGYSNGEALAQLHTVTLVARSCNERALRRTPAPFHAIEAISMPWLDRILDWTMRWIFKNNFHSRASTPFFYPFSIAFEWRAWQRLRTRIIAGEFDVVLRILPANPVIPSPFPFFLRNCSIPFVMGPINGGLPWPEGFSQADNQKSWIDNFRSLYRILPFSRSTYRRATAIIAGSSQTYSEFGYYRDKMFFIPENGVSRSVCCAAVRNSSCDRKLELIFLGALVPYKACDLALRAAAPLLRSDSAHFTVVGDGPERGRLERLVKSLGLEGAVSFCGMLPHAEAMQRLRSSDVMVYPSVREFGGAVVVEALAAGAVPLVADFGGPGDTVHPDVGYKVTLTSENDVVEQMEKALAKLASDRSLLERLRQQGMSYARERLTWDAKAQATTRVLHWAVKQGPKPDLPPPKILVTSVNPAR